MTRRLLRVVSHAIAEVPLLVVAGLQLAHGWVPTSDDAVIAWRTLDVFGGPVPLTGQFSQVTAAGGHSAFDLGPLQYFLLAVPVRIDPVHGLLWGAALLAIGLAALTIEALWSGLGPLAAGLGALALAVTAETLVQSTVNLAWNPSTGVYALWATMAAAVALAAGRTKWLPVAVGTASLAAQCHLSFAVPVGAAVVAGLVTGSVRVRRLPLGAIGVALLVGVACWVAPLVQELTGHPGNWTVIADSLSRHGKAVGFSAGLRALAAGTHVWPSWWVHSPSLGTIPGFGVFMGHLYDGSTAWGAAALLLSAGVAVLAVLRGRAGVASFAVVTTATTLAAVWTIGSVPVSQATYLDYYLYFVMWPVAMATVGVLAAGLWVGGTELWRLAGRPGADRLSRLGDSGGAIATGVFASLLALGGALLLALDVPMGSSPLFLMGWHPVDDARQAVALALPLLHHDAARRETPFEVAASDHFGYYQTNVTDSVAYLLAAKGYPARVSGAAEQPLGAAYAAPAHGPVLFVDTGLGGSIWVRWEPAPSR